MPRIQSLRRSRLCHVARSEGSPGSATKAKPADTLGSGPAADEVARAPGDAARWKGAGLHSWGLLVRVPKMHLLARRLPGKCGHRMRKRSGTALRLSIQRVLTSDLDYAILSSSCHRCHRRPRRNCGRQSPMERARPLTTRADPQSPPTALWSSSLGHSLRTAHVASTACADGCPARVYPEIVAGRQAHERFPGCCGAPQRAARQVPSGQPECSESGSLSVRHLASPDISPIRVHARA